MWTYGIELWGLKNSSIKSYSTRSKRASIYLKWNNPRGPYKKSTVKQTAIAGYENVHNRVQNNAVTEELFTLTLPGKPAHRLKTTWGRKDLIRQQYKKKYLYESASVVWRLLVLTSLFMKKKNKN